MSKSIIISTMIIVFIIYTSTFIVNEGERGIKFQFSSVMRNDDKTPIIYYPGLHFKIPFIQSIKILDARIQTMENRSDRFITKEKKDLIIDSYIKWRITNFSNYFLATGGGDIFLAEGLLKRKFSDRMRSEIGRTNLNNIITNLNNNLTLKVRNSLNFGYDNIHHDISILDAKYSNLTPITVSRYIKQTNKINQNSMIALGIEVVDIRIKKITLPIEVSETIYNRMRAERQAMARFYRSQGQEEVKKLRAAADYEVNKILATARCQGRILRAEGDAIAAKLFADTFNKDPDFYSFIRSLNAYKNSFCNNQDIMILSSDNDFFHYMKLPDSMMK